MGSSFDKKYIAVNWYDECIIIFILEHEQAFT